MNQHMDNQHAEGKKKIVSNINQRFVQIQVGAQIGCKSGPCRDVGQDHCQNLFTLNHCSGL